MQTRRSCRSRHPRFASLETRDALGRGRRFGRSATVSTLCHRIHPVPTFQPRADFRRTTTAAIFAPTPPLPRDHHRTTASRPSPSPRGHHRTTTVATRQPPNAASRHSPPPPRGHRRRTATAVAAARPPPKAASRHRTAPHPASPVRYPPDRHSNAAPHSFIRCNPPAPPSPTHQHPSGFPTTAPKSRPPSTDPVPSVLGNTTSSPVEVLCGHTYPHHPIDIVHMFDHRRNLYL